MTETGEIIETTLLGGRVRCLQPKTGFRVAIDTVLLAAAIPARTTGRLLDVGAGVGGAGLCVSMRAPGVRVDGLEIQPAYAELARRNADLNDLAGLFRVINADVASPPVDITPDSYDQVISNPPFIEAGRGRVPSGSAKAMATVESSVVLADWIDFCIRMAKTKATITIIHRADRAEQILAAMAGRVGNLVIFPLWPGGDNPDQPAKRVIVQGRKGMKGPTVLSKGLVLHAPGGNYTDRTKGILVDAKALDIR